MSEHKISRPLEKLPQLVRSIERNRSTAYAHFERLHFLLLVYVSSAGSGGGSPTDNYGDEVLQDELDSAINFLQSLLDQQQQALGGPVGDSSAGGNSGSEEPCQGDLILYQAALAAKDLTAAKRYLDAYTNCVRTHSETGRPARQSD